jgi:hypothetical protein
MRQQVLQAGESMYLIAIYCLLLLKVNASPNPNPAAYPLPIPFPKPTPVAFPNAQTINIYGAFSGAVYILPAVGSQPYSPALPAQCPSYAPQGCGYINQYNW